MIKMELYKGKDDTGNWVYGGITENKKFIVSKFQFIPVSPETVFKNTGIVDDNGTYIYEGDILTTETIFNALKYKVVWDSKFASFCLQSLDSPKLKKFLNCENHYNIIGNIIDDTDLI